MKRLFVVLVLAACDRSPSKVAVDFKRPAPAAAASGTWVAKFGTDAITDAELTQRFAEMNPFARTRFQTVEQRRDYLDGLVRYELLAQEAVRQGLANDPEVVDAARRVMVQALLKKELDQKAAVTDAQVAAYYQAHITDYVKPAMVRLSHLSFSKEHRAQAEAMLARALALSPLDLAGFGKLAREASEDERTKVLDGDLRFLSDDELNAQYGPELTQAAAALQKVGDVTPALVETAKALHVVKLQGRQLALNLSLEQARPSIQQVLLNDTRQERFRALLDRLKKEANLQVNESSLAAIVVDPKAPAVEAKGPSAGYLPPPPPAAPER
jgi:peptidyl-prolyl cis-trans isomerase C